MSSEPPGDDERDARRSAGDGPVGERPGSNGPNGGRSGADGGPSDGTGHNAGRSNGDGAARESFALGVGKRVVLGVIVAGFVVLTAMAAGNLMTPPSGIPPGAEHPEYAGSELDTNQLEASGSPTPSGDVGTVVFDQTKDNRFDQEDIAPLADAITQAGGTVRYPPTNADMATTLQDADVFVIVDPGVEYDRGDIQAIQQFLDDGGKLVVFGEPNRQAIQQQQQLQATLSTQRSRLTTLSSTFGVSFDTQYVYDQQRNDGNFKNVLVGPPDGVDHALVEGVDDVALYTAAPVSITDGTVLLRTASTAEQGNANQEDGYPVAVVNDENNVLAVGDASLLRPAFSSVGDNDIFIARIVEYMADADHQPSGGENGNGSLAGQVGSELPPADRVDPVR